MVSQLSPNDIVNVQVNLTPLPLALRNFGSLLIVGPTPNVIDSNERIRQYADINGVIADFGSTGPEYSAAALFFSQVPQPAILYIGFWAQGATRASIHGGALLAADQLTSGWTSITTGSMAMTIDGVVKTLSGLNFSGAANMNAVAAIIDTALGGAIDFVYNSTYHRFEVRSGSAGATSTITYATPTGSGVDISTKTCLTSVLASAPVTGIVAETALQAATAMLNFGSWYGITFAPAASGDVSDSQYQLIAGLIEAASPSRIFGITTQNPQLLDPTITNDLGSNLKALQYNRTFIQYSSSSLYAVASLIGRAFTVDFTGNNTTITMKFKNEPGVAAENLTESQAAALKSKNTNAFVAYTNGAILIQEGVMCGGWFFDERHGLDWLQNNIQTNNFNLFLGAGKIPQTDSGMNQIRAVTESSLSDGVNNGLIAPGIWNAPGFGQLSQGQMLPKGFYTFVPPMALQSEAIRGQRIATTIQVACKLAGAIHFSNVTVNVNR